MLNLLIISDSPKAEYVKSVLQPLLKIITNVVTDFDHGLKDVFEKRPSTICIQNEIGDVTGESVARHIQMLLGASAPTFILLHTGNDKARIIKGLYEHFIDLNLSGDALAEEIINTFKSLLGDQWEKNYIEPKLKPAEVKSSVTIPEESRNDADKLVDDFLLDLESSGFSVAADEPRKLSATDKITEELSGTLQSEAPLKPVDVPENAGSDRAQALNDDLVELLLMEANKAARNEHSAVVSSAAGAEREAVIIDSAKSEVTSVKRLASVNNEPPVPSGASSGRKSIEKIRASSSGKKQEGSSVAPVALTPIPTPAEFRISHGAPKDEEPIDDDLLLAFEENYRSEPLFLRRSVAIVLVCLACAAGGWYLVKQKPQVVSFLKLKFTPSTVVQQAPLKAPVAAPVQKPVQPPAKPPVMIQPLPAFIPKDGLDPSFAAKKPGWVRYVGKRNEFRLFSASGRIQAVQVLAVNDMPIPESLIKSVLQEFTGSREYQITSREIKAGVRVEKGRIKNKGQVAIYRNNGVVKAFVVSVN